MNLFLNDYYLNRGRNPQKLLSEMINLAQDMVSISKAPVCWITSNNDGTNN